MGRNPSAGGTVAFGLTLGRVPEEQSTVHPSRETGPGHAPPGQTAINVLQTVFLWNKGTCLVMAFFPCPFSSDLQKRAGRKGSLVNTEGLKGKVFNNSSKMQAIFDIWVNVHSVPCVSQMCALCPRYKNRHPFTTAMDAPNVLHMVPT